MTTPMPVALPRQSPRLHDQTDVAESEAGCRRWGTAEDVGLGRLHPRHCPNSRRRLNGSLKVGRGQTV
jgi:hypothetical protein